MFLANKQTGGRLQIDLQNKRVHILSGDTPRCSLTFPTPEFRTLTDALWHGLQFVEPELYLTTKFVGNVPAVFLGSEDSGEILTSLADYPLRHRDDLYSLFAAWNGDPVRLWVVGCDGIPHEPVAACLFRWFSNRRTEVAA